MSETTQLPDLDPGSALALLGRGEAVLVDAREPEEWTAGHAPQADLLAAAGVRVHNLAGGMQARAEAGLPVVTDAGAPGTVA